MLSSRSRISAQMTAFRKGKDVAQRRWDSAAARRRIRDEPIKFEDLASCSGSGRDCS
jgi:hypothetical protein